MRIHIIFNEEGEGERGVREVVSETDFPTYVEQRGKELIKTVQERIDELHRNGMVAEVITPLELVHDEGCSLEARSRLRIKGRTMPYNANASFYYEVKELWPGSNDSPASHGQA